MRLFFFQFAKIKIECDLLITYNRIRMNKKLQQQQQQQFRLQPKLIINLKVKRKLLEETLNGLYDLQYFI
jgi:hypothetical protein